GPPKYFKIALPCLLFKPNNGATSHAPSPNLVKKPVMFSAPWSVPNTKPLFADAIEYCTFIRSLAFSFPFWKSVNSTPASFKLLMLAVTAGLILTVTRFVGLIKSNASCVSCSSNCSPYGSLTAINSYSAPSSSFNSSTVICAIFPSNVESCPPEIPKTSDLIKLCAFIYDFKKFLISINSCSGSIVGFTFISLIMIDCKSLIIHPLPLYRLLLFQQLQRFSYSYYPNKFYLSPLDTLQGSSNAYFLPIIFLDY